MQLNYRVPLFVPANRPERFAKAASSGADAVILDLEDAVPADAKTDARSSLSADFTDLPVLLRINGADTQWHEDDVAAALQLPIAAIILPKAEMGPSIIKITESAQVPVVALIETARGLSQVKEISALPGVGQLFFGSIDYCADIGCEHSQRALLFPRCEIVLASRLAGLAPPINGVTTSIDDSQLIHDDARHARELGFGGKLAIHPKQIRAIGSAFEPSDAEVEWAHRVLSSGDGATAVAGLMVDEPVRIRARAILAQVLISPT